MERKQPPKRFGDCLSRILPFMHQGNNFFVVSKITFIYINPKLAKSGDSPLGYIQQKQ